MALIHCPECGAECSNLAEQCPNCAYPIARGHHKPIRAKSNHTQLIEKTAKRFKLMKLLAVLAMIAGIIMATLGLYSDEVGLDNGEQVAVIGITLIVLGVPLYMISYFLAWWHHG